MKNARGLSFVAIMIIIAICAIILRIAIEAIVKINVAQNESLARERLKLISAALENYAKDHLGAYPTNLSDLIKQNPPYLDKIYISESRIRGYIYECERLESSGYTCSATPLSCKVSGKTIYTVSTGNILTAEECSKKE
ncbi:MAG: hypothetical protein NC928_00630 [Candidatus Omnitrophica bacterium]|nr:hypothetical protein [Candidatus Omnitrophota bacterium]